MRKYRQVDADQNPIEPKDEYQQRKLIAYQNKDGMWIINAKLPQLEGGLVVKALEEIMRQQDKNSSAEDSEEERASFSQKKADALLSMSEHFIATATVDDENGGIQALAGHERCQVAIFKNDNLIRLRFTRKIKGIKLLSNGTFTGTLIVHRKYP